MDVTTAGHCTVRDCESSERCQTGDKKRASYFEKNEEAMYDRKARLNLHDQSFLVTDG